MARTGTYAACRVHPYGSTAALYVFPSTRTDRATAIRSGETLAMMAAGRFSVELGPSYPLADAATAHRAVEGGVDGKITLLP